MSINVLLVSTLFIGLMEKKKEKSSGATGHPPVLPAH